MFATAMWVSIASDAACAAALQQAVVDFGVVDTDTLQAVLQIPETAAGLARALCTALQAAPPESMTDEHADEAQVNVGTQTSAADGMVDTLVAEAMISEALCMVDEAQHRERLAGVCARSWEDRAELGATLLRAAEARTDRAQAARQAAERSAAAERAAKQMAEHMLAAEAALADAAVESARNECVARRQAEAQRDLWQALAGAGRGGRCGRGGRGHVPPPPAPPPPAPPPAPPPPPPVPELITLVLAVSHCK